MDGNGNAIHVYSVSPTIAGNTIARHGGSGIYLSQSSASITGNTIQENGYGIYLSESPGATITGNAIMGNGSYGAYNASSLAIVSAQGNYWGHPSGPLDDSDDRATGGLYNPTGLGDRVTDYVIYSSWLADEPSTPTCGDELIEGSEECDDGGTASGDGCDSSCQIKRGWTCEGEPSVCSEPAVPALFRWSQLILIAGLLGTGMGLWRRRAS